MLIANCCEISMLNSFIMLEFRDIENYPGAILYWVFIYFYIYIGYLITFSLFISISEQFFIMKKYTDKPL